MRISSVVRAATAPLLIAALTVMLAACGAGTSSYPSTAGRGPTNPNPDPNAERESIFGEDGLVLFGGKGGDSQPGGGGGIGVNSFLWRASLDTLSFIPLASADPFGGVIITEWHSNPSVPDERFKLTVYILDKRLRADGLKVAVFRQKRGEGEWLDVVSNAGTGVALENAILMRARELRVNTLQAGES